MTDRAAYDRYQARFFDVFRKFSGRLLAADEHPSILEGSWDGDKLVLMSFPDETGFQAWANSPDYLEISRNRKAGTQGVVLLAKGFTPLTTINPSSPPRPVAEPEQRQNRRRGVIAGPIIVIRPVIGVIDVAMVAPIVTPRGEPG